MKWNQIALGLWVGGATLLVLNLVGVVSTVVAWVGFAIVGVGGALAYQSPRKRQGDPPRQGKV